MGLYRFKPSPSSRMGILWTISTIKDVSVVEFGCMGHMLYSKVSLERNGVTGRANLYSTHISETDIAFGDTDRIEKAVKDVIEKDKPKALFLLPSSIPQIIGIDMKFIAKELQVIYPDTIIRYIPYGSFELSYNEAIEKTLHFLVKELSEEREKTKSISYNIIGSCADLYKFQADCQEISRILKNVYKIDPNCILTSDTDVDDIKSISSGHINLVIREEGIKTAKYLEKKYNMPYLVARPYGMKETLKWIDEFGHILKLIKDESYIKSEITEIKEKLKPNMQSLVHCIKMHKDEATISIGGHKDVVKGIKTFAVDELGLHEGEFWCNSPYLEDENIPYYDEEKWIEVFENHEEGILMGSGEALKAYGLNLNLQVANPDIAFRVNPYVPPLVGFRGALELLDIWVNKIEEHR